MEPAFDGNIHTILPDDCLQLVFEKLETTRDRNAFGLTCRRWLQIQNLSRRSLVFDFSYNPKVYRTYAMYMSRLLTRFPRLSSVCLAGFTEFTDSEMALLRDLGNNLRHLSLHCCFGITDSGIFIVTLACPCLVSVTLYRSNITDLSLEYLARSCQLLENLNLSYCMLISDHGISALSRGCLKLRVLVISYCRGISGTGFRGCHPTLAYLEANSCWLSADGLQEIVSGGGLEYLNISNLRSSLGSDGLDRIGCGYAAGLKFLNLRMCRFISSDSVTAIAEGCPSLEEWSLALCHEVRTSGWEAIGANCRKLKILHVNRCRNLCDQGLQALRNGCIRLRVLHINGCQQVTCLGLEMFKLHRRDVEVRGEECVIVGPSSIDDFFMKNIITR